MCFNVIDFNSGTNSILHKLPFKKTNILWLFGFFPLWPSPPRTHQSHYWDLGTGFHHWQYTGAENMSTRVMGCDSNEPPHQEMLKTVISTVKDCGRCCWWQVANKLRINKPEVVVISLVPTQSLCTRERLLFWFAFYNIISFKNPLCV